jgi:TRAP-type mannitol/chloroaromatic compound transport system permease large subunit
MVAMNLQTSFLTPPFGFSLFYLKSVAPPSLPIQKLYQGAVPFIIIQLVMVAMLMIFFLKWYSLLVLIKPLMTSITPK